MAVRKILHVDMDAFYASVEQHDHPELKGKPIAVGGGEKRGVICAASYEARRFGVKSAMPGSVASRLCPDLIFIRPRFSRYQEVSARVHDIFHRVTDLVEPLALDEAYLDVTGNKLGEASATRLARWIRERIAEETGLTASAGVSFNKFLAKVASGRNKPDGLTVVRPEDADAFSAALPIEDFYGVGPVTAQKMKDLGFSNGASLRAAGEEKLTALFGRSGAWYWNLAWGRDDRPVEAHWERKSVGAEETFSEDLQNEAVLREKLGEICGEVSERLKETGFWGKTVTVKVRWSDFTTITRSRTVHEHLREAKDLLAVAEPLLIASGASHQAVRLLGVSVTRLSSSASEHQLTFAMNG